MFPNAKASELIAVMDTISPVSQGTGTVTTGWISAATFNNYLAVINTGVLGASATVDAKLQQANTSGGGAAKDVSGKAITQIVKASGDNKQALINLRDAELDVEGGFAWFRLSITVGTAASLIGAQVFGANSRFAPASDSNNAAVVQVV